jgi:NADPH:quinone reductase-like Zn-dependent oxidoreductase
VKAIVQIRYGSVDDLELQEVPVPAVGDEDVLVRVRAASLHPDVWHVVSGRPYVLRLMGGGAWRPRCRIPGTDVAGIVERVGSFIALFNLRDPTLLGAGRSVLINGAGGGVGSLALQIAKSYGAH